MTEVPARGSDEYEALAPLLPDDFSEVLVARSVPDLAGKARRLFGLDA